MARSVCCFTSFLEICPLELVVRSCSDLFFLLTSSSCSCSISSKFGWGIVGMSSGGLLELEPEDGMNTWALLL